MNHIMSPKLIWFTGLSGSGKTTLSQLLLTKMQEINIQSIALDGDQFRFGLCRDLGFSKEDRSENIRRAAEVSKLLLDSGQFVIGSFISPFDADRKMVREIVGSPRYFEVFMNASLSVCEKRDVKGLYARSRSGQLVGMTGIDSPYEIPSNPDFVADSECKLPDLLVADLLSSLNLYRT